MAACTVSLAEIGFGDLARVGGESASLAKLGIDSISLVPDALPRVARRLAVA